MTSYPVSILIYLDEFALESKPNGRSVFAKVPRRITGVRVGNRQVIVPDIDPQKFLTGPRETRSEQMPRVMKKVQVGGRERLVDVQQMGMFTNAHGPNHHSHHGEFATAEVHQSER